MAAPNDRSVARRDRSGARRPWPAVAAARQARVRPAARRLRDRAGGFPLLFSDRDLPRHQLGRVADPVAAEPVSDGTTRPFIEGTDPIVRAVSLPGIKIFGPPCPVMGSVS